MVHIIDLKFQGSSESIAAFILESDIGPILFETGPYSTFHTLKIEIEKIGYTISDIKHVFISHIHFDHAGAAWKFAEHGASIYVHPAGLPHLNNPEKLWGSAVRIYGASMEKLWGVMEPISLDNLVPLMHLECLQLGGFEIKALHTPGHAVHHIAFSLNDMVFGGDVAGVCIGDGPVVPPCPPPDIHIEDWCASSDNSHSLFDFFEKFGIFEFNCELLSIVIKYSVILSNSISKLFSCHDSIYRIVWSNDSTFLSDISACVNMVSRNYSYLHLSYLILKIYFLI